MEHSNNINLKHGNFGVGAAVQIYATQVGYQQQQYAHPWSHNWLMGDSTLPQQGTGEGEDNGGMWNNKYNNARGGRISSDLLGLRINSYTSQ